MKTVFAFTDGSCDNNTGDRGGFGVMLKFGQHTKEIIGGQYVGTTNSRMELLAAIVAMESVKPGNRIKIYSDSQYVINSICKKWVFGWEKRNYRTDDGSDRANADLWRRFLIAYRSFPKGAIEFIWVKGHNGHTENEICDGLARSGAKLKTIIEDDRKGMFNIKFLSKA